MRAARSIRNTGTVGRTTLKLRKQIERARRMERTRSFYDKMNIDKECVWTHSISKNFEKIQYDMLERTLVPDNIYIVHREQPARTIEYIIGRFIQIDKPDDTHTNFVFEPYWSRMVRQDDKDYPEWKDSKEITHSKSFMRKFLKTGDVRATNPITNKIQYNPYLLVVDKRHIKHDANEGYYDIYDISKHDTFGIVSKHLPTKSPEEICKLLPQHRLELARTFEEFGSKHPGSDDPLSHVMSFLKTGGTRKRTLRRTDVVSEVKRRISTHIPKEDVGFLRNMKFRGRTQKRHHRRRRA